MYHGTLFTLLNGYGLLGGLLFLSLFLVHGALWLGIRTEGDLQDRSIKLANALWFVLLVVAVALQVFDDIKTESVGEGNDRRVKIIPISDKEILKGKEDSDSDDKEEGEE